jgi:hypothetical protein
MLADSLGVLLVGSGRCLRGASRLLTAKDAAIVRFDDIDDEEEIRVLLERFGVEIPKGLEVLSMLWFDAPKRLIDRSILRAIDSAAKPPRDIVIAFGGAHNLEKRRFVHSKALE